MSELTRVTGVGDAIIHKGDPRLPKADMDAWWNGLLGSVQPASSRPHLYGSDAGLCARKNVFYSRNSWSPFNMQPSTRTYMAIGVALENLLAEGLKEKGKLIAQNPYLVAMPEVKIRGKIDLVIFDSEDELALVEVKSCGELPSAPNPQHLAQIQLYCAVSGVHRAWLTYISRKVQDQNAWGPNISIRSFRVDTGEIPLTYRLYVALLSNLAISKGKLPLPPAHFRKTEECRYCPFLDFCWKKEPRYGGGPPDAPPIESLSIEEEISLSNRAHIQAKDLYDQSDFRRTQTLTAFIEDVEVPKELRKRLKTLI